MSTYRPQFISQFDEAGVSNAFQKKNCVFAAGAMALERQTMGGTINLVTAQYLRHTGGYDSATAAGLDELKHAWRKFGDTYAAGLHLDTTLFDLDVHKSEPWDTFVQRISEGRGAVILTDLWKVPAKYQCTSQVNAQHAFFVNEVNAKGDLLCFDPVCRPSDKLSPAKRRQYPEMFDPQYASETQETQPKWIPQQWIRSAAEAFNSRSGVQAGYTRITVGGGTGGAPFNGAVYIVWRDGSWQFDIEAASDPASAAAIVDRWDNGPRLYEGFPSDSSASVSIADPEVVIQGEEARVNDWSPTAQGYGVRGRAFYSTQIASEQGIAFRTRKNHWYEQPWDIPLDYFWPQQPDWPEGAAYLADAVERANRTNNRLALVVVNRDNLWGDIVLGGLYSIYLPLEGPYPSGFSGVVRVVQYSPDEDAGTLQLLCEWVKQDIGIDQPPPVGVHAAEDVIAIAKSMFGVKYVLGKESRTQCDCSGLVYRSFIDGGWGDLINNQRLSAAGYTRYFADLHRFSTSIGNAERGDLIVYKHTGGTGRVVHIGIYLGNNHVVSALTTTGVTKTRYDLLTVDFYGVLKPAYPERTAPHFLASTAETNTDPEEAVTPTTTPPAQVDDANDPVTVTP